MPFLDYDGDATELLETYGILNLLSCWPNLSVYFLRFLDEIHHNWYPCFPVPDNLCINRLLQEMPEAENHVYYTTSHTTPVSRHRYWCLIQLMLIGFSQGTFTAHYWCRVLQPNG